MASLKRDGDRALSGLFEAVLHDVHDGLVLISVSECRIVACSNSAAELSGYAPEELIGRKISETGLIEPEVLETATRVAANRRAGSFESWLERRDGGRRWIEFSLQLLADHDLLLAIIRDETERKHQEEALRDLADRDPLTHVFNRRRLVEELERRVREAERYDDPLTLLIADVDNLKQINDRHGHEAGDAALRTVARALRDSVRKVDVVARLGGDEFAAILSRAGTEAASRVGAELERHLEPVQVGPDREVPVRVSVGYAELDELGDHEQLLRAADEAMYESKVSRRASAWDALGGPRFRRSP